MDSSKGKPSVDLEDLLIRAMARQTPKPQRKKAGDSFTVKELADADKRIRERFYDPANWERRRTVALVHEESETLLGNFAEYVSKIARDCRRLVRVNEPTAVDGVEHVSGAHWIAKPVSVQTVSVEAPAEEVREAIVDLHMPEMDNVFAPAVMVSVVLHWGSVARVELTEETHFFAKDKRVHLILPDGMDVREALSLETKLRIKEFLGL